MSRVHYSFQSDPAFLSAHMGGRQPRVPFATKMRDRRYMKSAMETAGLFFFGFGSTGLVLHLAAGFLVVSRMTSFLPSIGL